MTIEVYIATLDIINKYEGYTETTETGTRTLQFTQIEGKWIVAINTPLFFPSICEELQSLPLETIEITQPNE